VWGARAQTHLHHGKHLKIMPSTNGDKVAAHFSKQKFTL
jgi:hypothetical protein